MSKESSQNSLRFVLLRGLSRGRGHWADFPVRLQKQFPTAKIELLDLPGNGERNQEVSPKKISEYVEDLRAQSELLQEGPVCLLALSLGGMIAADWASRYPSEVDRSFLVCTSSAAHSRVYDRFRLSNYPAFAPLALNRDPRFFEEILLGVIANNEDRKRELFEELVAYSQKYPASLSNFFRQILAASLYRFPQKSPGKVHLIGSYGDRLVSPSCTKDLAASWQLSPRMHPWAGHDIPVDDPDWLIQQISDSLSLG